MPNTNTRDLTDMRVDELREAAKDAGISGVWRMRKDELIRMIENDGGRSTRLREAFRTGGKAKSRPVAEMKGTRYAQEITSTDEQAQRDGRTLVTTNHDVIRQWAEARGAIPATVPGTEKGDRLGVLRFDFPGYGGEGLKHVSWDLWFRTFDERTLHFIYQERTSDGGESNFFRLDNPVREDG